MPGTGVRALTMVEKEAHLVDPFFDGEDDDVPVDMDMEMVYEAMKHVPLPDIEYADQDYPISGDHHLTDPLPCRAIRAQPDPVVRQGILKRKVATEETVQPKRKGGGTSRVPKRLKVELQSNGISSKPIPVQTTKVEIVVGTVTAAAAKVAAEVPPDVLTSGTVAETGPRPDFSLWTVEDDLLLKNAMEAGAAMEALARGAMRFSRRFTVKELRERWRALLYDPDIAEEAAVRMAEAEYASNYCAAPKSPVEQKNPRELARKRRENSIRTLYYKRSKVAQEDVALEHAALEDVALEDIASGVAGSDVDGACGASNGVAIDGHLDSAARPEADVVIRASAVDSGSLHLKEGLSPELEDGNFSQMYSLLAAGGIKAVIAAIPAGMSGSAPEQEVGDVAVGLAQNGENDLRLFTDLAKSVGSKQVAAVLHELAEGTVEGTLYSVELSEVKEADEIDGSHFEPKDEGAELLERSADANLTEEMVDHREISNADTKVVLYSSQADQIDGSTLEPNGERAELLERSADANLTEEMEEAETIEALYRECCCGEYDVAAADEAATADETEEEESREAESREAAGICYCTETDEANNDLHLPSSLIDESCTGDLDCPYLSECCIPPLPNNAAASGILQPAVCSLNTEDTDVPSLDDCLLASPSRFSSPSQQDENLGYADSPSAGDGYYYADEDAEANVDADCEDRNLSPRQQQGVVSSTNVGPGMNSSLGDTSAAPPAAFGSSVDRSAGRAAAAMNPGNNHVNGATTRGSLLPGEDENIESTCTDPAAVPGPYTVSTSAPAALEGGPQPAQNLQQHALPPENSGGRVQAAANNNNNLGVTDWQQTSTFAPMSGDRETDASPSRMDLPMVGLPDTQVTNREEAPESVQDPSEDDVESDGDTARFSDIEAYILGLDLDVADEDFSVRAESRENYMRHGKSVVRSEQAATAAMHRALNLRGAFAILYGLHSKFFITKPEVVLGRATTDNIIDIDLGKEGRANKVSRQQAQIKLKENGVFYLRNLGRRSLTVNNISVNKGERAILGSNCLIEVGGMRFIFDFDRKLVEEHISKRRQQ